MRKASRLFAAALFLVALGFSQSEARADTIVITSGFLRIGGAPLSRNAFRGISWNFAGGNIASSGGAVDGERRQQPVGPCAVEFPCPGGTFVSSGSTAHLCCIGSATLDGVSFSANYFTNDSRLTFSGSGIVLPASPGPQTLEFTVPFTMTGTLVFHPLFDPLTTVFSGQIEGQGMATMTFNYFDLGGTIFDGFLLSSIRYDFSPAAVPAAVPEPATLLLLGTGLAGVAARRRRRRNASR